MSYYFGKIRIGLKEFLELIPYIIVQSLFYQKLL